MSKQTLERMVRRELSVLNDTIDEKIIKGISYRAEARRHKFLTSKLSIIRKQSGLGWLSRSLSFF